MSVSYNSRGRWDVVLAGEAQPMTCETLEDATRIAYQVAARESPCELIVCDAYRRVVRREIIKDLVSRHSRELVTSGL